MSEKGRERERERESYTRRKTERERKGERERESDTWRKTVREKGREGPLLSTTQFNNFHFFFFPVCIRPSFMINFVFPTFPT